MTRIVVCTTVLMALGALSMMDPVLASGTRAATQMPAPDPPPVPNSLPDGGPPGNAVLYSTSCSSQTFCVSVGYVDGSGTFPLVETFTAGSWVPSVPPLPQGYDNDTSATDYAALYSVSCGADGSCAAVGAYQDPTGLQQGLIETLSAGAWSSTEASPSTPTGAGVTNLMSVSCASATSCTAVGQYSLDRVFTPLVFSLSSGAWTIGAAPPLPADYAGNLVLSSVSCTGAADCVVVGSYADTASSSQGMILTLASGTWSALEAPLPSNADLEPPVSDLPVLDAVDCVDASYCVAGGGYIDNGATGGAGNSDALVLTLESGRWVPSAAPLPAGAPVGQGAIIDTVLCYSIGSCTASGTYGIDDSNGQVGGMTLTLSGSGWSAASGAVPSTPFAGTRAAANRLIQRTRPPHAPCARSHRCRALARGAVSRVAAPSSFDAVGISCTKSSFCAAADSSGDGYIFNDTSTGGTPNWTTFSGVASVMAGVSCFSSVFCEAVGGTDANEWNGSSWSATVIDSTNSVLAVSCPGTGSSPDFCMAVDSGGNAIAYSGTAPTWKTPKLVDSGNSLHAISCSASTFCMAVDGAGNPVKYYSGTWTKQSTLAGSPDLLSVSCPSSTFCLAGDNSGNTWKFNGTSWAGPYATTNSKAVNGMGCISTSFCWGVDGGGHGLFWNNKNKNWTSYPVDTAASLNAVSCAGTTFCAAVDNVGNATMYSSSGWLSTNVDKTTSLSAIACSGSSFCATTDQGGYALTVQNSDIWTWTKSSQLTSSHTLDALDCSSSSFCEAVDNGGDSYTYNGSWQTAVSVTSHALLGVSCVSSSFCDASDNFGEVWTSTNSGGSWTSKTVSSSAIDAISCFSSSFCEAVDSAGDAYKWNGTKWSTATVLGGGASLTSISCPTASACEAVNDVGFAFKYSSSWVSTTGTDVDGTHDLTAVSCSGSASCEAVDSAGDAVSYRSSWKSATSIDAHGLTSVSCSTLGNCEAADTAGDVLLLDGPGNWSSPMLV